MSYLVWSWCVGDVVELAATSWSYAVIKAYRPADPDAGGTAAGLAGAARRAAIEELHTPSAAKAQAADDADDSHFVAAPAASAQTITGLGGGHMRCVALDRYRRDPSGVGGDTTSWIDLSDAASVALIEPLGATRFTRATLSAATAASAGGSGGSEEELCYISPPAALSIR